MLLTRDEIPEKIPPPISCLRGDCDVVIAEALSLLFSNSAESVSSSTIDISMEESEEAIVEVDLVEDEGGDAS